MTDREQLVEHRKQIILSKMKGKTEAEKNRAIKNLDRMNFTDHEDFLSYVKEATGSDNGESSQKQATEMELDEIMGNHIPKEGQASQSELNDVFKYLKI